MKTTQFVSVEIVIRTNQECDEWIEWFERQDNYVTKLDEQTIEVVNQHRASIRIAMYPSPDTDE